MIDICTQGAYLHDNNRLDAVSGNAAGLQRPEKAREGTIACRILAAHSQSDDAARLRIVFDALASHDITYVGIVQTARAGGMKHFPLPYVLTNCHNSLCAVGGTINEDDHLFGLSAAKKYGGEFVPAHMAVIHQYMREMYAGCGKMILGSDSHTRYGALGALGVGEGGPELVKQLLGRTYDLNAPEVVAVYLEGTPKAGVGPQDVALTLIRAVFKDGLVTNKVLEFVGPGVAGLSVDYRLGIDVMTTETACLTSVWQTDDKVREWLAAHGRVEDYHPLAPENGAWYDGVITIDLSRVEPMIALPFHPSNAWTIREFLANADDLLHGLESEAADMLGKTSTRPNLRSRLKNGAFMVDQGIIAGCSGGVYDNLVRASAVLAGRSTGNGAFSLSIYPASQPQYLELVRSGLTTTFMEAGASIRTAFCGPCFGAGDVPAHNSFSIRHTTRNFPNREGSKPANGQIAYVALMDARSIAATAVNGGRLTSATALPCPPEETPYPYVFHSGIYDKRVYRGFGRAETQEALSFGPNIADWPAMPSLPENLILQVVSAIYDPVTTTDELIPSGETSSYRSNPLKLAEFTLSRKDPQYLNRARQCFSLEETRRKMTSQRLPGDEATFSAAHTATAREVRELFASLGLAGQEGQSAVGSVVFALKPGDGSAREQAASCQKVLGGWANIAGDYATKRYRSNLVNWGMLPFILDNAASYNLRPGDRLCLPGIKQAILSGREEITARCRQNDEQLELILRLPGLTKDERAVILAGCLINYYAQGN
ncbi:MAG: hydratase [Desulfovibrio sp.]|jgi:aconitate hydratase|nr:hydratase [Desulfovibrio sp.]